MLAFSDACERNKDPILNVLKDVFAKSRRVLEIGSGTSQHAMYFARNLPHLTWQPSDLPENLPRISERLAHEGPVNVRPPVELDVCVRPWAVSSIDAIFTANTFHIMPWDGVIELFHGVREVLAEDGMLCVYGPFRYEGGYTSESNALFDQDLRRRDPWSGLRDFEAVDRLAEAQGLTLQKDYCMPANNQTLVWKRSLSS